MNENLEKILSDVCPYGGQGYTWEELKDELDDGEKDWLGGMAYCVECIDGLDIAEYESDHTTIGKIKIEIFEYVMEHVKDRLMSEIGMFLTSFGDNHPED